MKGEGESVQKKVYKKEEGPPQTPIHKSSTKKIREPLRSPKKHLPQSKEKLSNSEINVSCYRKSTEQREKIQVGDTNHQEKKEKQEVIFKKDKRCIQPTEKIVERINNNLLQLQARIQQLFQEQIDEDGGLETVGQVKPTEYGENKGVSSLVFKKNGSTLSLTKNNSKKRLEGRLTHDGVRSDRKYKEMGKASNMRVEAGWK